MKSLPFQGEAGMDVDTGLREVPDVRAVRTAVIHIFRIKKIIDLSFERYVGYIAVLNGQGIRELQVSNRISFEFGIDVFVIAEELTANNKRLDVGIEACMVERERVACSPIGRERDGPPCIGIFPAVTTPSEVSSPCEPRGPINRELKLRSAAIGPFHIRRIEITHTADVSRSNELVVIIHEIEVETDRPRDSIAALEHSARGITIA